MKTSEFGEMNNTDKIQKEREALFKKRKPLIDWISGLIGGFVSVSFCAPLDLARTRHMVLATTKSNGIIQYHGFFDTLKKIYHNEGFFGLYKGDLNLKILISGYSITAYSIPFFHSLYFSIYFETKKKIYEKWNEKDNLLLKNMLAALFTGFICDTITNPLWVVRTRVQSQFLHQDAEIKYKGIFQSMSRIVKEEGPRALLKGLAASYVGLTHAVILYPSYEELKRFVEKKKGKLDQIDIFASSIISKFLAMVLTYPHVVIRARLQDNRIELKDKNVKLTFLSQLKSTIHKEGVNGLYSGLRIDLIRCLPANAITFMTFEFVKNHFEKLILTGNAF